MRRSSLTVGSAFLSLAITCLPLSAQLEPPSTGGVVALEHELRLLGHTRRVLMIGAHPDDEDTELLTLLVRGLGVEAAYLSLNRGEGGQNLIGAELGPALGLVRTEELLAARRLDGARQYFTRAYDFGYSKSLAETWTHWPQDSILKDVVRIVRRFRPQIIVSVFSGTPRDGHGQHQAAGWAAREAFDAAGDSTRFPELAREEGLAPWIPLKLYRGTNFDTAATTLALEGGELDPAVGRSFHQIAMAGRSLHRSQDMGRLQGLGPSQVRLALLAARSGKGSAGGPLFAGIDTVDARAVGPIPYGAAASADALLGLRRRWAAAGVDADQLAHLDRAITIASGVVCDARSDDDRVVPGQRFMVTLECWNSGGAARAVAVSLRTAQGLHVAPDGPARFRLAPGALASREVAVQVDEDAAATVPYFRLPSDTAALYDWRGAAPAVLGQPFEPPPLSASVLLDGVAETSREVSFRLNDQARGEVRRPVEIVPRIGVRLDPATELWSTTGRATRRFTVTLTHFAPDTTSGTVTLARPSGWPTVPPQPFRLEREDARETFAFELRPPPTLRAGDVGLRAEARDGAGRRYEGGIATVDYPHIRPRSYPRPSKATIRVAPLRLPAGLRVGYVRGAADRVPEALEGVGLPVTLLAPATLEQGNLARFDAIIVGPRAYETDSTLVSANPRLLAYVRRGGLVIVQYQQPRFFLGGFAPFPLTVGGPSVVHDRVTDETAPVRLLDAAGAIALTPNRLGSSDWDGWLQERGLYFARSWDRAYQPVLETHDPGEAPLEGGLLVASVGKGTYVYTGLSFFRQLPAGVPGAFRLFANLLALARPGGH